MAGIIKRRGIARHLRARNPVDWGAFVLGMIATPLVLAIFGGVLVIPAFAAVLGLPAQIALGAPAAWLAITRAPQVDGRAALGAIVAAAFFANLLALPAGVAVLLAVGESWGDALAATVTYVGFGMVFAPLEGLIFGLIYRALAPPGPPGPVDAEIFA